MPQTDLSRVVIAESVAGTAIFDSWSVKNRKDVGLQGQHWQVDLLLKLENVKLLPPIFPRKTSVYL